MSKKGPCFHCRIEQTPLWRQGPAEKPVLCNACGSRWRTRGTLDDYIPKHGLTKRSKLNSPLSEKPAMPVEDHNNMNSILLGKTETAQHCSSCLQDNTSSESRSGSLESSVCNYTQTGILIDKVRGLPFSLKVPKKKRSVLKQYCLTSTGRLHRQLLQILHEQQAQSTNSCTAAVEDDDLLFLPTSTMVSSTETALGAMLLK